MDKRRNVPLEEALNLTGSGLYSYMIMIGSGLVDFSAYAGIQLMSVAIPAAACDLQLTTYQKGVLTSMVYTGMIFSSHLWGFLADSYGRRQVMLVCSAGAALVSVVSSLAPSAYLLMASSFILGLLLSGIFTPVYVYISECSPRQLRSKAMLVCCAISVLSSAYLPGTGWLVLPLEFRLPVFNTGLVFTSWRLFVSLLSLPYLTAFLALLFLPETPKFLLSVGRQEDTMRVLRRMYAWNTGNDGAKFPVESVSLDSSDEMPEEKENKTSALTNFFKTIISQTRMIFTPPFLKYTFISCLLNVEVIGVFNTVLLWFPETVNRLIYYSQAEDTLSVSLCTVMSAEGGAGSPQSAGPAEESCRIKDDVFLINIASGLSQSFVYVLFSIVQHRIKVKPLIVGLSVLTTLACSVMIFAHHVVLIITSELAMVLFLVVMFPVYISIVVDFFPTSLRTNATSIIMLCGRLSSVVGSQAIGALYDRHCQFAFPALFVLLIVSSVLFFIMPTKRKCEDQLKKMKMLDLANTL